MNGPAGGREAAADHGILRALAAAVRQGRPVALVTVLASGGSAEDAGRGRSVPPAGAKLLVPEPAGEPPLGSTGDALLDARLAAEARRMMAEGATGRCSPAGIDVFIQSFAPPPVLYVIGAVHPAGALAEAGKLAGFRVVVCDPRSPFATPERLPAADEIVRRWPDEVLAERRPTPRDAVCVLTHDLKFDVPAIRTALASPAGYIGVMGSRRTHARRVAALREAGVDDDQLARLFAPIGLEIGARTPEEMAIAIVAQIIATLRRGGARSAEAS